MADEPALLYLEPDDEITSVVRRLRETDGERVVIVAPGRAKATSSATALRLLARVAADEGREVAIVGDALTRSLAAEADLPTFLSVDDARAARHAPLVGPQRAAINVLRADTEPHADATPVAADQATAAVSTPTTGSVAAPPQTPRAPRLSPAPDGRGDETLVVPLARSARQRSRSTPGGRPRPGSGPGGRWTAVGLGIVALAFLLTAGGVAAVLPAATITIQPATTAVGPRSYELRFEAPDARVAADVVEESVEATTGGTYEEHEPARGAVTFFNWTFSSVVVDQNVGLAAGEVVFGTLAAVTVPPGQLTPVGTIEAGQANVDVQAVDTGPAGNVAAGAIDTILDGRTARALRGFPNNPQPLVTNPAATAGGLDEAGPEIVQADVDAALATLRERLAQRVAEELGDPGDAVWAEPSEPFEPDITIPPDLVGTRDRPTFEITGRLEYRRVSVGAAQIDENGRARLAEDGAAVTPGHALLPGTERVSVVGSQLDGEALVVDVEVSAASAAEIDEQAVIDQTLGLPRDVAGERLASLGAITIDTWPGWVGDVPRLEWRIDVVIVDAGVVPAPSESPADESAPAAS